MKLIKIISEIKKIRARIPMKYGEYTPKNGDARIFHGHYFELSNGGIVWHSQYGDGKEGLGTAEENSVLLDAFLKKNNIEVIDRWGNRNSGFVNYKIDKIYFKFLDESINEIKKLTYKIPLSKPGGAYNSTEYNIDAVGEVPRYLVIQAYEDPDYMEIRSGGSRMIQFLVRHNIPYKSGHGNIDVVYVRKSFFKFPD